MSTTNYILAASGRPFKDWDAADMKRQIVATELDDDGFEVVTHPEGGFAVTRAAVEMAFGSSLGATDSESDESPYQSSYDVPEGPGDALAREFAEDEATSNKEEPPMIAGVLPQIQAEDRTRKPPNKPAFDTPSSAAEKPDTESEPEAVHIKDYTKGFPEHFVLNVAPRAFIHLHLITAIGCILMLFPHLLLAPLGGFRGFDNAELGASVLGTIRLGAMFFGICSLSKFLYTFLFYRYEVTPKYVEAVYGFIAREAPKTYYGHIRSTKVDQAWWERLLIVGAVKLGTGATDQHEVVLKHVSDPKRLEKELQRRYEPFITRGFRD